MVKHEYDFIKFINKKYKTYNIYLKSESRISKLYAWLLKNEKKNKNKINPPNEKLHFSARPPPNKIHKTFSELATCSNSH